MIELLSYMVGTLSVLLIGLLVVFTVNLTRHESTLARVRERQMSVKE